MIPNTQPPCTTTGPKLWVTQHCHLLKKKKKKNQTHAGVLEVILKRLSSISVQFPNYPLQTNFAFIRL